MVFSTISKMLDFIGTISTIFVIVAFIAGVILWFKGIFPVLLRLGNGLAKRKIAIFAKGDNLTSLKSLILDSKLFNKNNIVEITAKGDFGKAENITLFLTFWPDWEKDIDNILIHKKDTTALIVYAPQDLGFIPKEEIKKLNEKRNVTVTNFRGRLLNDIIISMITTSYEFK